MSRSHCLVSSSYWLPSIRDIDEGTVFDRIRALSPTGQIRSKIMRDVKDALDRNVSKPLTDDRVLEIKADIDRRLGAMVASGLLADMHVASSENMLLVCFKISMDLTIEELPILMVD